MADDFVDFYKNQHADADGVNRSRWKFDEGGFASATNAALLLAQQQMRDKIKTIHDDIVSIDHPSDYQVTLDGVPIDKVKFEE